jgi:hypothetical protein
MPDALRFGAPRSSRSNRHSIEKMQQEVELTVSTKLARQEIYCSEACSWRVCDQTNKLLTVQQPRSNPSKLPKCWEKRYGENTAIEGVLHILATFSKPSARLHTAEVAGSNPVSPTREIRTLQVETLEMMQGSGYSPIPCTATRRDPANSTQLLRLPEQRHLVTAHPECPSRLGSRTILPGHHLDTLNRVSVELDWATLNLSMRRRQQTARTGR